MKDILNKTEMSELRTTLNDAQTCICFALGAWRLLKLVSISSNGPRQLTHISPL